MDESRAILLLRLQDAINIGRFCAPGVDITLLFSSKIVIYPDPKFIFVPERKTAAYKNFPLITGLHTNDPGREIVSIYRPSNVNRLNALWFVDVINKVGLPAFRVSMAIP